MWLCSRRFGCLERVRVALGWEQLRSIWTTDWTPRWRARPLLHRSRRPAAQNLAITPRAPPGQLEGLKRGLLGRGVIAWERGASSATVRAPRRGRGARRHAGAAEQRPLGRSGARRRVGTGNGARDASIADGALGRRIRLASLRAGAQRAATAQGGRPRTRDALRAPAGGARARAPDQGRRGRRPRCSSR
jgi:hypothetical protein